MPAGKKNWPRKPLPVKNAGWHCYPASPNVAAAVILAMVAAAGFLLQRHFGAAGKDNAVLACTDSIRNKSVHPYKATLPDGFTVWLNGGAVVYLAGHFGQTDRHVK